jgi:hypothetical protein
VVAGGVESLLHLRVHLVVLEPHRPQHLAGHALEGWKYGGSFFAALDKAQ